MDILDQIHIDPRLETTLAQQLKQQLNWLIASGQLKEGDLLPSVRRAASRLGINFNTVRSAYQKLEADGLVQTRQGTGTTVLPNDPQRLVRLAAAPRSHTVGVIIPSLASPFYLSFLQGVESVAGPARTMLILGVTHDDPGAAQRCYAQLAARQVDGILLVSQDDSAFVSLKGSPPGGRLQPQPLPLVAADWPASPGYAVNLDLENAGYQATRHLLEHGHRQVGLVTYAIDLANVLPVNQGYQRALHEAGIAADPRLIERVHGFDATAGEAGARRLLGLDQPPKAMFAISDMMAMGACSAIQQAGLRVPEDVAVIGVDDIPLAALVSPSLSTVAAPALQLGQESMKLLESLVAGKRLLRKQIVLPTNLVIRQSCGCPGS